MTGYNIFHYLYSNHKLQPFHKMITRQVKQLSHIHFLPTSAPFPPPPLPRQLIWRAAGITPVFQVNDTSVGHEFFSNIYQ